MKKLIITLIVVVIVAGSAIGAYRYTHPPVEPEVNTVGITRGDIVQQVGATGSIEAVTTVDVGTQVNGVIKEMLVDFNDIVRQGQLIAKIDPATIEAKIESDKASLISQQANLERQKVSLEDSQNKLRRTQDLFDRKLATQQDLESAQVTVKTNQASIKSQLASITQSEASLHQDEVNLGYTNIYAPINGIVINRKVDVGQTVVSNNAATSMFQIAADLTKMQVKASVDESDVGLLRPGQRATFTVDAYPNQEFEGTVKQVRLQPVVTQNVVTYVTIINVPNNDLKLKPGMTASVKIEIARVENVMRLPNSTIRFRATREMFEALKLPVPPELAQQRTGRGGAGRGQGQRGEGALGRGGGDRSGMGGNRTANMTPEQRQQFDAMRRERGGAGGFGRSGGNQQAATPANTASITDRGGTIDALFGPLSFPETRGRIWVYTAGPNNKPASLKAYNVRLGGISDGTFTQLIALPEGVAEDAKLVTGIDTGQASTTPVRSNSPIMGPQRGGGGGMRGGR
jgi:HlyD family secretion protein